MRIRKFLCGIVVLVVASLLLSSCSPDYPQEIKNELLSLCTEGVFSGRTVVYNVNTQDKNQVVKLCQFRLEEFTKTVTLSDYQHYEKELYEALARGYRMHYTLPDIYKSLSPNSKKVFESISKIMLGLDTRTLKTN